MNKVNECTCPSGDGSLVHPCPAHPAVEQAGWDERAAFEAAFAAMGRPVCRADYDQDAYGTPFDDGGWTGWQARAALAQPSPKCATCNGTGQIVVSGPHYCGELQPPEYETEPCDMCSQPSPAQADEKPGDSILCYGCFAKGVGPDHFDEAGKCLAAQAEQAEAERPEMSSERAAYFMRRFKSEEKLLGPNEQAAVDYVLSLIAQHERIVGDLQRQKHEADTALAWATRHYQTVEQERDAALAKLAELEAKLSDPTAVHQWQFSNAWFDGSEEVVLKAGKEGSPIRTLYAAPVAQAQPEETPGEILAAKLIETWVTKHGKPAPWSTAVEITAVATNMPNDERERLLALDDDVDAQAQHSVPAYVSYTTRPAESLAGIALRQLKEESRWVEIRDINAPAFPDMQSHSYYPAGTVIKLPAAAPGKEVGHE
ncbi:TPA: hypothetical protein SL674_001817 [Pseudomonas aeruginosa]|nr:hypothetical protein [Pseudomonas aeruginosa]